MSATHSNMSYSLFLESSFDTSPTNEPTNPTSHDNAAHPFDRQQDFDDFIKQDLMEAYEQHSVDLDFLLLPMLRVILAHSRKMTIMTRAQRKART